MSATASQPSTPGKLAVLPHDSLGPALLATSWSLTTLATIFLALRGCCKISRHVRLWWDDWILVAAWVILVINVALATHLVVDYSYGNHSWDIPPLDIDSFFLVVAVRATFTTALWFIIVTMNIALAITALLFWIPCTPVRKSWTPTMKGGSCWDPAIVLNYNIFSGAYSAAVDFILALLPWKLLLGMQMQREEKFGLVIALSMGLLAGIAAVIKTVKFPNLNSEDAYDAADVAIWDMIEPAVSMIGACIPVLRVLVREMRSSGRPYHATEDPSELPNPTWPGWKADGLTRSNSPQADDDGSEKSIFQGGTRRNQGRPIDRRHIIVQTQEVTIESRPRGRNHVINDGYELGMLQSR
ncbi:hypothetical protein QBC34DRAFT_477870 [Podospora aff. communis PSN243]|uniref:Rhodopsin domain-containing protein n=1 Tax=Podospora aff. communis PSN243 TaxID=3040156 RepID=A0AAV9G4D8_9PEZI|nr:hypothetical protein QBC34DRAFT_477870 [Podospora aff. communis PSN243]